MSHTTWNRTIIASLVVQLFLGITCTHTLTFPTLPETLEMLRLSSLVYTYNTAYTTNCSTAPSLSQNPTADDTTCHFYERNTMDTQVLIVSSKSKQYVTVSYAGTDNYRNVFTDSNALLGEFGKDDMEVMDVVPPEVRVHEGFNYAVFHEGLFQKVLSIVQSLLHIHPHYQLWITGHSLGAADSILSAVALRLHLPSSRFVTSLNFGCPKTGNRPFKEFVQSLSNLAIYRFVNGIDLISRLPDMRFVHVGHTVQMNHGEERGIKVYWWHEGNVELGYKGVPFGWETYPFVLAPVAMYAHIMGRYEHYFLEQREKSSDIHYMKDFEKLENDDDSNLVPWASAPYESYYRDVDDSLKKWNVDWETEIYGVSHPDRVWNIDGHDKYDKGVSKNNDLGQDNQWEINDGMTLEVW